MSKSAFNRKRIISMVLLLMVIFTSSALAYTTDQFNVTVEVREDNSYAIEENIKVNFDTSKHGIFRYIPLNGSGETTALRVTDIKVEEWMYEEYEESGAKVIRIGDPDIKVKGEQSYDYSYLMSVYDDGNKDSDMLYIDLLPTDWETPIESTVITMKLPKAIDKEKLEIYASGYGSDQVGSNISWMYDEETMTLTVTGEDLNKGTGVTVFCPLEEGYWVNQLNSDWAKPVAMVIPVVLAGIIAFLWLIFGRDRQVIEVVEFYPPENMSPAEVGFVIDSQVNKSDLMSMIIYFADKGYMTIDEYEEEKFRFNKVKDVADSEKMFAKALFDGIFPRGKTSVKMEDLDEDFGEAYLSANESLSDSFSGSRKQIETKSLVATLIGFISVPLFYIASVIFAGIYIHFEELGLISIIGAMFTVVGGLILLLGENRKKAAKKSAVMGMNIGGMLISCSGILFGCVLLIETLESPLIAAVFGVSMFISVYLTAHMYRRTDKGAKLYGRVLGFRNFIETAEVGRINMLVEENPTYFFNILPYAYVLGLTDKWAKHFEHIKIVQPVWYTTYNSRRFSTWNYYAFSRSMRRCGDHVTSNIKFKIDGGSDVGGGGFSGGGGGFTGGGFGGGGGGSW